MTPSAFCAERGRGQTLRATGVERGRWLADVLDGANRALAERGLRDDRESGWLAADAIGRRAERFTAFGSHARLLGLTRWDSSLLALVERLHAVLSRAGGGCRLELPLPSAGPLHDACAASFAQLEAHWASSQDPPLLTPMAERPDRTQPAVISAHNAAGEARAVVRTVLEALERGAALDGIAIVPAELSEAFLEPLRFELGRAGIPLVEPRGRPAIAAPRAHRTLELLGLAAGPIAQEVPDRRLSHAGPRPSALVRRAPIRRSSLPSSRACRCASTARARSSRPISTIA